MGRRFQKTYLAIVAPGAPEPAGGLIEAPLRRELAGREAYMKVCAAEHAARPRAPRPAIARSPPATRPRWWS